ncbi:2-oxoglutarate dehydrogenase E1 component [Rickettsiella grylli]|uniref:oxoglutarate dehydrogenase (succinyl-transferring) n=1 Tax=Rickettsiella grylli TaxID=59196 RepID=A8PMS2_9COXI|nr:2-oxoglutarate dehydrogenase E1 component [Rickettsiella grylli]EDP46540.1 oxoglutarate dehydrogenase (succinyl-transferring), E1 component [Rickettsiella grylli]
MTEQCKSAQALQKNSYLFSANGAYLETLFEQYLHDPSQLSTEWQTYFSQLVDNEKDVSHADIRSYFAELSRRPAEKGTTSFSKDLPYKLQRLIDAYRRYGHYQAHLDPLALAPKREIVDLNLEHYDISEQALSSIVHLNGLLGLQNVTVESVLNHLKKIYCRSIGFEYEHIACHAQRTWLQERIESVTGKPDFSAKVKKNILKGLIRADGLEKFLGNKFVAQKRFSLEGGDSLIPLLEALITDASRAEVEEIVIGMAHRGRLNVLINILGKSPAQLFEEFEGKMIQENRSGDVKYHKGFAADLKTDHGVMHVAMAFNPSHLEIVNPVVEGSVRSRQERRQEGGQQQVLPLLIHGDAAFSGQGVVMENFELSQTQAYGTGGTLHIVLNNQLGFTTDPQNARSSWYCTDPAKMVDAPIFHVNSDDPEAVLFAIQLAFDFRQTFRKDVVIDLVCYRRHGHNEADEPAATQPLLYQTIKALQTPKQRYADVLIRQGIVTSEEVQRWSDDYRNRLDQGEPVVQRLTPEYQNPYRIDWRPYRYQAWRSTVNTGIDRKQLKKLATQLETLPEGFVLQAQVAKIMADRQKMTAGHLPLNWGYAEIMAYATLLQEGYGVRLSGQDSERGTFFHRHAVLHDFNTNQMYVPLAQIAHSPHAFTAVDSILSEAAVMAFEYGYAISNPNSLVIWEAQYGDFVNGAQVVIDQFLSSSEQKWGRLCGLVLFLPHAYEGSGPEHTSARLERFLQLCAQDNMQVCIPSTPAQIFHVLRRQMLRPYRKPLILMTPKSLLRHKLAVSTLQALSEGQWQSVISDFEVDANAIKRVVLCSGKVYYDLFEMRREQKQQGVALIRIEQLYPFPDIELKAALKPFSNVNDIVWCQEESKNQGAWYWIQHHLISCLEKNQHLRYVGRSASAAPAVGSPLVHAEEQHTLIKEALT